jgi:hypothetical protein
METSITWVGIDAHKKTLAVAAFHPSKQDPDEFTIDNDERAIRKLVRRLEREGNGREVRIGAAEDVREAVAEVDPAPSERNDCKTVAHNRRAFPLCCPSITVEFA